MAFKIAGSMAVKDAARQAHPVLLEPMMDVEVVTPSDYMGDVIGDLSARRGKIDRKSTRLNSSHGYISYAVFCLKKKKHRYTQHSRLQSLCRLSLETKSDASMERRRAGKKRFSLLQSGVLKES